MMKKKISNFKCFFFDILFFSILFFSILFFYELFSFGTFFSLKKLASAFSLGLKFISTNDLRSSLFSSSFFLRFIKPFSIIFFTDCFQKIFDFHLHLKEKFTIFLLGISVNGFFININSFNDNYLISIKDYFINNFPLVLFMNSFFRKSIFYIFDVGLFKNNIHYEQAQKIKR